MGVFADLTQEEYRTRALGYRADLRPQNALKSTPFLYESTVPPKEVDWLKAGAVTEVGWAGAQGAGCWSEQVL